MFSFGHLVLFILTRSTPFASMSSNEIKHFLKQSSGMGPVQWLSKSTLEAECKPMVESCWNFEDTLRPTSQSCYDTMRLWPYAKLFGQALYLSRPEVPNDMVVW